MARRAFSSFPFGQIPPLVVHHLSEKLFQTFVHHVFIIGVLLLYIMYIFDLQINWDQYVRFYCTFNGEA